ncbi:bifunctional ADP-dependent NAD(P)H-hydrate dehydratase/NAD(P)H-hydrate epimerase [Clostridium sediminicola]|uniref:NAD(P)H-hydrate dehydratase n=1 Tax=Clostridium sediminicola TaxID=3114879 RepID=UPI0031F1F979
MKILKSCKIREIDKYCIEKLGIPGIILMENAANKVIDNIDLKVYNRFVIVCGVGNNGGDGLVVARHLYTKGKKVEVFIIGDITKMSKDCKINYEIIKNLKIKINVVNNMEDIYLLREAINRCEVTIDSIFGTGIKRNVEGIYNSAISIININSKYTISIDMPSGINSDTGKVMGIAINANKTVTFQMLKRGFINYGTDCYTGKVIVEDIGIPEFVVDKFQENEYMTDIEDINKILIYGTKYLHKGNFGKVNIIAGSEGFVGAAYIATQAAVRIGAGLVTLTCPKAVRNILSSKLVEAMTVELENKIKFRESMEKYDAIAAGPGMGNTEKTKEVIYDLISNSKVPLVLDADGINVLNNNVSILFKRKSDIVLTPHPGEFSRISGKTIEQINSDRINIAKEFAEKYKIVLLLKGYNTIITDGDKVYVNPTGNSSMATGGMGDCLTGIIAALMAQGIGSLEATYIGAYIHGYCGEKLSKSMFRVNAEHVLNELPYAMKELQLNKKDC